MTSICNIGNAGIDLIAPLGTTWPTRAGAWQVIEEDLLFKAGGCGLDTAVGIAKLGAPSKLVAGVGAGGHGRYVRQVLEREGVQLEAACTHPTLRTPLDIAVRDAQGVPSALHFAGASKHVDAALLEELHERGFFQDCAAIHLAGVGLMPAQRSPSFAKKLTDILANSPCLELSLDVSLHERLSRDEWRRILYPLLASGLVHVFSPSYDEACQIHGLPRDSTLEEQWAADFYGFLRENYAGLAKDFVLILRDGKDDSVVVDADLRQVRVRAEAAEAIDLSAAGEAWWAGFLVARHRQREARSFDRSAATLVPALRLGHAVAKRAVQTWGSSHWDLSGLG